MTEPEDHFSLQNLELTLAAGAVDVRSFAVQEGLSTLFQVHVVAVSRDAELDFEAVVGQPARFEVRASSTGRSWSGVIAHAEQIGVSPEGLSTYGFVLAPRLWLLTQRRNHRIFQQLSEPDIVERVLAEWQIDHALQLASPHPARRYRVQYAESDFDFIARMLEETGISFYFEDAREGTRLVLTDAPERANPREPLPYVNSPQPTPAREYVTDVALTQQVTPGRYTMRDHDHRRSADFPLLASAGSAASEVEDRLERYHYTPGAFLFRGDAGPAATPAADDRGTQRTSLEEAARVADARLQAQRGPRRRLRFETSARDVRPGMVIGVADHPRADVSAPNRFLVVGSSFEGTSHGEWVIRCEAQPTSQPFRPPLVTPRPRTHGMESATVVGPQGEDIHTDEFGRVRVQFHWDREGQRDERSSCWIHVSQPWGGAGYGAINLPRVGQEVLVDFLGGDPDRPVVVGRVFTNLQPVPYPLPANRTRSGWRSYSSPETGGYNEIMFEDAAGQELLRVRAERDRVTQVNRDCSTNIDNDRRSTIHRDDETEITRDQRITVHEGNREVTVQAGSLTTTVRGDILQRSLENQRFQTRNGTLLSEAKRHVLHSDDWLELHAGPETGGSTIIMTPTFIVIEAPQVFINPGLEELARVRSSEGRDPPRTPEQLEAARRQARIDAFVAPSPQEPQPTGERTARAQQIAREAIRFMGTEPRTIIRDWANANDSRSRTEDFARGFEPAHDALQLTLGRRALGTSPTALRGGPEVAGDDALAREVGREILAQPRQGGGGTWSEEASRMFWDTHRGAR